MAFKVADHPPKNGWGFAQLGGHLMLLVLTSFVISTAAAWWLVPAMMLHGLILVALFAPNHECVHRTVFSTPWINDWTAAVLGWLLFIPSIDFRYFHFAHHRHTQDPERDPELASAKPTTLMGYLFALTGIPLYRSTLAWFWALAVSSEYGAYLPANKRAAATRQARLYIFHVCRCHCDERVAPNLGGVALLGWALCLGAAIFARLFDGRAYRL